MHNDGIDTQRYATTQACNCGGENGLAGGKEEKLGWEPKVRLEDGLLKTLPYFVSSMQERLPDVKPGATVPVS